MYAEIGLGATFLALLAALYAIGMAFYGVRTRSEKAVISARNAAIATFPLLLLAAGVLVAALINQQYQMSYVWTVTNPDTPLFYRITALWGSQKGSLLFWSLLMSGFAFGAIILNWRSDRRLMPYAMMYMMATLAFFLGLVLFMENPFDRWWIVDGKNDLTLLSPAADSNAMNQAYSSLAGLGLTNAEEQLNGSAQSLSCIDASQAAQAQQILTAAGASADVTSCVAEAAFIPPGVTPPDPSRLADTSKGLNPLLRHFGMIIHPPMLYLGFVGFVIPFAFAMAALASGDLSTNWIKATRRWALVAWLFLSLGLLLGGRWAYDVLGWGGYWGWDPVENAAFLPWLVGTAFLHSVMIQEKRGMLKVWNMFLVIGAFSAVIFGTFATRSGLIDSVHSFAQSPIGYPMFAFWFGVTIISVGLILWRWNRGELRDEHSFGNMFSREMLFIVNNVVFVALAGVIFWGSFGAPIASEIFTNTSITLGKDYFLQVTPPLFITLYILMGIAPLSAWGATSLRRLGRALLVPFVLALAVMIFAIITGTPLPVAVLGYGVVSLAGFVAIYETFRGVLARHRGLGENWFTATTALFARNRRRYGGYIIHLGVTVIGLGVIGSTLFQSQTQQTLAVGQSLEINGYQMRYDGFTQAIADDGRQMQIADVTLFRGGQEIAQLRPRQDIYPDMPMTIAGQHSTLENDVYIILVGWEPVNANTATFKVFINPLINLIWYGGIVLIFGTFVAAWPKEPALAVAWETRSKRKRAGAVA